MGWPGYGHGYGYGCASHTTTAWIRDTVRRAGERTNVFVCIERCSEHTCQKCRGRGHGSLVEFVTMLIATGSRCSSPAGARRCQTPLFYSATAPV